MLPRRDQIGIAPCPRLNAESGKLTVKADRLLRPSSAMGCDPG